MSWLLVALVPVLLMLATFGLDRLEAHLADDTVTAQDVAEFLEHAEADDVSTLVRAGMPEALDHMHRRQSERVPDVPQAESTRNKHHADPFHRVGFGVAVQQPPVAARRHKHSKANPQFKPTRHANRV